MKEKDLSLGITKRYLINNKNIESYNPPRVTYTDNLFSKLDSIKHNLYFGVNILGFMKAGYLHSIILVLILYY